MNYIPLSVKTDYEVLSSLIKCEDLISFALSNNVSAIGITDTNMFSAYKMHLLCKEHNIKLVLGVPFNVEGDNFTLYAKNYEGYVKLLNLVSIRNVSSLDKEVLKKYNKDLICVTKEYSKYLDYKLIYEKVFLSYSSEEEKLKALMESDNIVYINDSLYINDNDKEYLKYLYLIKDGKTIDDIKLYDFNNTLNKDIDVFDSETTYKFASLINIKFPIVEFKMPLYSSDKYTLLNSLCAKGLSKRCNGNVSSEYLERLKKELTVIHEMDYTDYFLIVYDFILYAKKNGIIVGPGRGSAAGSLVSYSLGITEIDPIKYNLIFERFLNKDRVSLPDIDVDIEYKRRDEVIKYVKNKYGKDKVANIITFGTLLPKMAIRDVARVLKINNVKVDSLTKLIKDKETFSDLINNKLFMNNINSDNELVKLFDICKHIENIKRHTSVHAAGVVLSDTKLMDRVPLYKTSDTILTGYTMEYLEAVGLLKIDFLAIKNLSVIGDAINLIKTTKNMNININRIPLDNVKTLDIFNKGNTTGIFQFESEGMKSFLKKLKINNFNDIAVANALFRPGPKDNIEEYLRRRNGKTVKYLNEDLEDILKETLGIIVYQEQIMEILKRLGNFSYSEADIIRRAMSKKNVNVIKESETKFLEGAYKNNISIDDAKNIYDLVLKFAGYGFNKSHAVSYSLVAYQMAFLKANFTNEFMCSLLNSELSSEKVKEYIGEAKRFDVIFKDISVNESANKFYVKDDKLIYPLNIISKISKDITSDIVKERNNGPFTSYVDFVKRVYSNKINKDVISNLIYAGALDSFKLTRKTMIDYLDSVIEYAALANEIGEENALVPEIIDKEEYDNLIDIEYKVFGFYIKNHPVTKYKNDDCVSIINISNYFDRYIKGVYLVESVREINTKKGDAMAFLSLSDETGSIKAVVFPKDYKEFYPVYKNTVYYITGKVEKRLSEYQIIVSKLEPVK